MSTMRVEPPTAGEGPRGRNHAGARARLRATTSVLRRLPLLSIALILLVVIAGAFAPALMPHDPLGPNLTNRLAAPSAEYWLGTDTLGRDVFSRLILGARATLIIIVLALTAGSLIGLILGTAAGYLGGWFDSAVSRAMDALLAFPTIFFALLLAVSLGPGVVPVVLAIALILWARFARVIRGEVLAIREREFVVQAQVYGASRVRIILRHILPNVASAFMVLVSINLGSIFTFEAILSFLGAGVPPPRPSWGGMISEGQQYVTSAWWLSIFPGIAIMTTVLAFNHLGEWVRNYLDPKQRALL
jgi:peptide/nickel transport system permease protein